MANQATSSLNRQPSAGAEEADRLRARIKHLRHVLRTSENHRVQRLKMVVVKLRSLCHSVERRYQGMLYLLGRQVQSIAESMCGTSRSSIQPLLPSLSPTQMAQWFLQVQSLAEWIQDHVTSLPALSTSMRQHDHVKMEQSEVSGEALVNIDKQLVPTVTAIPEYGWSLTLKSSSDNCSSNSLKSPKHLSECPSPTSKELHDHCFTSELEDNSSIQYNSHLKSPKGLYHGSDKQNEFHTESISKVIPNKCIDPEHDLSRGHFILNRLSTSIHCYERN
uniref:Uncharacterized protein n=1 Tax=Timema poppense TaxID=170557 RepID=A0A7R9DNF8_TIMPO|nr:unnamed protein product [Timema poppensis]